MGMGCQRGALLLLSLLLLSLQSGVGAARSLTFRLGASIGKDGKVMTAGEVPLSCAGHSYLCVGGFDVQSANPSTFIQQDDISVA